MAHADIWWRIARRNLGRNPRRTALSVSALALGFAATVVMVAVSDGMTAEMIDNGTGILSGQVQLHASGYLPERETYATIGGAGGANLDTLLGAVATLPGVTGAAPRVYGGGLISAGTHTIAAQVAGMDPAREHGVSRVLQAIVAGTAPAPGSRTIAVGEESARKLAVRPGDTVVVVAPAADGSLGNDLYEVSGVFHTGLAELDAGFAVLPLPALQGLLALEPGRVHEIAVTVRDPWSAPAVARALAADPALARLEVAVEPWTTFRPEMAQYARLARAWNGLLIAIVFLMATFGVTNTLLMSTFERRREFAVEGALGAGRGAIARTVVYEGLLLGAASLAVGAVLAAAVVYWWHIAPLDLSRFVGAFTLSGALVRPVLRAVPTWQAPLQAAAALLLTSLLAALYPAFRATRIPPADALAGRE
jgi:ABC-type lipoprotein release transport system permease subunit